MKTSDEKEPAASPSKVDSKPLGRAAPESKTGGVGDQEALQQRLTALEEERDRLKSELGDTRDRYLRARADYDNLVKRASKEAQDSARAAKGSLILRLLAVAEALDRAEADLAKQAPNQVKGVRMVAEDLRKLLKEEGVREIESLGQAFNYRYHQAVDRIDSSDKSEGTILEVVQRGYLIHGEILRPALVKVAAPKKPPTAGKTEAMGSA